MTFIQHFFIIHAALRLVTVLTGTEAGTEILSAQATYPHTSRVITSGHHQGISLLSSFHLLCCSEMAPANCSLQCCPF